VVPGDQVVITARLISIARGIVRFKSEAHVSRQVVARGRFVVQIKEDAEV
jgi:3-hydroxymyristoyl/3-hydroxydecanoyl-(acyl carrier protein) dehydratase